MALDKAWEVTLKVMPATLDNDDDDGIWPKWGKEYYEIV